MEAVAKTKYLKGSPRKARLVIDLIRGVNVSRALSILKFTDKRAADPIQKCLSSAIANATYKAEQQNIAIDPDDLWINLCYIDMGPTKGRRRMRPAPQGRAYREQRHYCHITIQVTSEEKAKSEEQMRLDALRDERIAARKAARAADKAKAPVKKETKAAKVEEKPAEPVVEEVVETPVEMVDETPVETVTEEVVETETHAEEVEENKAQIDAEVSAAHETSSHTTAEEHAEKPVDEVMERTNKDLERQ
ncbi:MAG TPA: 50S ribosomal protein L22 [Pyrinomonadaceae bacterium]|nr:50S ribosomal protein L22 [Acidobacteriota bacterium]HQZ97135.1 50S ribosomal protein L22 [Pyrinomonadaceae bacterium]